ncbi:endoplasmic reticulum-plasma membrane tethering protein [Aureococcus anophagefferens]|uniref:Endoplasmic reticulum-plasma membrane tethering protein n=1 Tax=Aureococcus anophagefferens TaxID=44056 RepID=A0ABR1FW23_AURAN
MWALPAALAVGVVLERAGCPLVVTCAIAALLALTSYLGERRAASLAAARKEREAEDLDQRFREAALASGVKISPREKILLEELDCRTWLDQALTTVWATYHAKISGWLEGVLAGVLDGLVPLGPIDSFTFKTFQLGAAAPRVRRVVPVRLAEDGVVMLDLDLDWRGSGVDVDLSARLGGGWIGASVPLGLDHVSFKATLRVRCVLGDRSPFAALVDVAFARKPEVLDFGLSVISGDITGLPSIPALVSNALEGVIDGLMVWPRRLSFPLDEWWHPWDVPPAVAHGVLRLTVDRARDLPGADLDGKSDPFVVVEVGGADAGGGFEARETLRTATKSKTLNPTWDGEVFTLTIADPAVDRVRISVFDYDLGGEPDPLGSAWLGGRLLRDLARGSTRAFWLRLEPPSKGAGKLRYGGGRRRCALEVAYGALLPAAADFPAVGEEGAAPTPASPRARSESLAAAGPCAARVALRYGKPAAHGRRRAARAASGSRATSSAAASRWARAAASTRTFPPTGAALHIDAYDADPHGASEHLGAATFPLRDVDDAVGGAVWAPLAAPPGRWRRWRRPAPRHAGRVRARALDRPKQMAGGVGTAATVLRAANIFRSKANTPDRVSCLSAMGASRRVDDSDDDDDDGTPKRTACVNFRRRSGDGGGVEPVPEAMTR